MAKNDPTPELEFEFEDITWDDVESSRKRKTVEREAATTVKDWLQRFKDSGRDIGGRFTFLALPADVQAMYMPRKSEKGDRTIGGMAALVRIIKSVQDTYDVFPVPMDDPAVHARNTELGEDIDAEDARYGGFLLVKKSAWTAHKNPTKKTDSAPTEPEAATE